MDSAQALGEPRTSRRPMSVFAVTRALGVIEGRLLMTWRVRFSPQEKRHRVISISPSRIPVPNYHVSCGARR